MSKPYELRVLIPKNSRTIAEKVKEIVKTVDPEAGVFVFGSTARETALSDVDILVVVKNLNKKYKIMIRVYKEIKACHS